ncbi:MAG: hypothetical protein QOK05_360 [Chloroflexota bacterium]|nr:hypothetical protein [Chloroflexota bacterium]
MTEAATPRADPAALTDALRELTASMSGRGVDAVDLRVVERDQGPAIAGQVLTFRQARDVEELARRLGAGVEVVVVADPGSGLELGWAEPALDILDVWREPARAGEEMGRQTQYLATEDGPLRVLGNQDGFALVQGADLAMGWAAGSELAEVDARAAEQNWAGVVRAREGAVAQPPREGVVAADVLELARMQLGTPYIWGGRSDRGYDCSGLVQRVLSRSTGLLLPRHTGDQRRVGDRVVAGEVRTGDLLFARPREQRVGHVLLMTSATTVLHACRTEHRVIEEGLAVNARRYQHQGWRRPVALEA